MRFIGGFGEQYGSVMATIGIGEKGNTNTRIQVASPGGHSSVPPPHTVRHIHRPAPHFLLCLLMCSRRLPVLGQSIGMLASLLVTYESNPFPVQLARDTPVYSTVQCLASHARSMDPRLRKFIVSSATSDKALQEASEALAEDVGMRSLIGTTQAIDVIGGGVKTNALPEQAWAIVNHRIATDGYIPLAPLPPGFSRLS